MTKLTIIKADMIRVVKREISMRVGALEPDRRSAMEILLLTGT
jgi:hypothetical protein